MESSPSFEGFGDDRNNNECSPKAHGSKQKPRTPGRTIPLLTEKSSLSKLAPPSKTNLKGYRIPKLTKKIALKSLPANEGIPIKQIGTRNGMEEDAYSNITKTLNTLVEGQNDMRKSMEDRITAMEDRLNNMEEIPMTEPYDSEEVEEWEPSYAAEISEESENESPAQTPAEGMPRFENLNQQYQKNEQVDKEVHPMLADHVNGAFLSGISDKAIQESIAARPSNCTALVPVRVNQMIWDPLTKITKWKDIKLSECQSNIMKAASILAKAVQLSAETEVGLKGKMSYNICIICIPCMYCTIYINISGYTINNKKFLIVLQENLKTKINWAQLLIWEMTP